MDRWRRPEKLSIFLTVTGWYAVDLAEQLDVGSARTELDQLKADPKFQRRQLSPMATTT
jgi:hypothetical protein